VSERGVFAVDRGIWNHPLLASKEPFSRREAWLWLVSEAAWKPRVRCIGSAVIDIVRGQLAHSIRFIAEAWNWPKSNVARFLACLKTETMIDTKTVRGLTVITICNYDEYQRVSLPDRDKIGTLDGTQVGQSWDKQEDIKTIEDTSSLRSDVVPARPKRTTKVRTQLPEHWQLDEIDVGYAAAKGFSGEKLRQMSSAFANHHQSKGNLMADWHAAWRTWCDNEIKFNQGKSNGRRTVHDAANDLHARLLALDDPAPSGLRDGAGEGAVRLLPPRGRQ
jgi:hypothetical protein